MTMMSVFDGYTHLLWEHLVEPNIARITRKARQARALGFNPIVFFSSEDGETHDFDLYDADELRAGDLRDKATANSGLGLWIGFPPCMFEDNRQRAIYITASFVQRLYELQDKAMETVVRFVGDEPEPDTRGPYVAETKSEPEPEPEPEPEDDKQKRRYFTPGYGEVCDFIQ